MNSSTLGNTEAVGEGETLFREGDSGNAIYLVKAGLFKSERNTQHGKRAILELHSEHEVIGWESIANQTYQSTVTSLRDGVVEALDVSQLECDTNLKWLVTRKLCEQLWRSHDARVGQAYPVYTRICRMFVELGGRFGTAEAEGITLELPLSHESFAAIVGTSRVTLTRVIGELSREGALLRSGKTYSFNPHALREVGEAYL